MHDNSNNKLMKKLKNQILTENNQERTLRIIRKQDEIPGENRTKTLNDLATAVKIEQVLKDLSFPVEKKIILAHMQDLKITNTSSIA